jgi:hypothetical protein
MMILKNLTSRFRGFSEGRLLCFEDGPGGGGADADADKAKKAPREVPAMKDRLKFRDEAAFYALHGIEFKKVEEAVLKIQTADSFYQPLLVDIELMADLVQADALALYLSLIEADVCKRLTTYRGRDKPAFNEGDVEHAVALKQEKLGDLALTLYKEGVSRGRHGQTKLNIEGLALLEETGLAEALVFFHKEVGYALRDGDFTAGHVDVLKEWLAVDKKKMRMAIDSYNLVVNYHKSKRNWSMHTGFSEFLDFVLKDEGTLDYVREVVGYLDGGLFEEKKEEEKKGRRRRERDEDKGPKKEEYFFGAEYLKEWGLKHWRRFLTLSEKDKKAVIALGDSFAKEFDWDPKPGHHGEDLDALVDFIKMKRGERRRVLSRHRFLRKKFPQHFSYFSGFLGAKKTVQWLSKAPEAKFKKHVRALTGLSRMKDFEMHFNRWDQLEKFVKTGFWKKIGRISKELPGFSFHVDAFDGLYPLDELSKAELDSLIGLCKKWPGNTDFETVLYRPKFWLKVLKAHDDKAEGSYLSLVDRLMVKEIAAVSDMEEGRRKESRTAELFSELGDEKVFQDARYLEVFAHIEQTIEGIPLKKAVAFAKNLIRGGMGAKEVKAALDKLKDFTEEKDPKKQMEIALVMFGAEDMKVFDIRRASEYEGLQVRMDVSLGVQSEAFYAVLDYGGLKAELEEKGFRPLLSELKYLCRHRLALYDNIAKVMSFPEEEVKTMREKMAVAGAERPVLKPEDIADFVVLVDYIGLLPRGHSNKVFLPNLKKLCPGLKVKRVSYLRRNDIFEALIEHVDVQLPARVESFSDLGRVVSLSPLYRRAEKPFEQFGTLKIDWDKVLSEPIDVVKQGGLFNPNVIEEIRILVAEKEGHKKANDLIFILLQNFLENNAPSYDNLGALLALGEGFADNRQAGEGKPIYALFANFTFNFVADFLNREMGNGQSKQDEVRAALIAKGTTLEEMEKRLVARGISFEIKKTNVAKGLDHLAAGNWGYLARSVAAKAKAKVAGGATVSSGASGTAVAAGGSIASSVDAREERVKLKEGKMPWRTRAGVEMKEYSTMLGAQVRLVKMDRSGIRAEMLMGEGKKPFVVPTETHFSNEDNLVFYASFAFSTKRGEMTELAVRRGEVMSYLVSTKGKDALVMVNPGGEIKIFDKRSLSLKEISTFLGLPFEGEDRKLEIAQKMMDYKDFVDLMAKSKASLMASFMLIKDGKPEFGHPGGEEKSRRLLLEYNDGSIGVLNTVGQKTTNEAINLALSIGGVKTAVYMDTGDYDSGGYMEPGRRKGDEPKRHVFGWREAHDPVTNMLAFSVRPERMKARAVKAPKVVGRSEWGATAPKEGADITEYQGNLEDVYTRIVVHHSAIVGGGGPKGIQDLNLSRGWDDIAYNYVIGQDGKIYEGRDLRLMAAHAGQSKEANEAAKAARDGSRTDITVDEARKMDPDFGAIGIVVDGNFEPGHDGGFNPKQKAALLRLTAHLKTRYNIPMANIIGHREVKAKVVEGQGLTFAGKETVCPGEHGQTDIEVLHDQLPEDTAKAKEKLTPQNGQER